MDVLVNVAALARRGHNVPNFLISGKTSREVRFASWRNGERCGVSKPPAGVVFSVRREINLRLTAFPESSESGSSGL